MLTSSEAERLASYGKAFLLFFDTLDFPLFLAMLWVAGAGLGSTDSLFMAVLWVTGAWLGSTDSRFLAMLWVSGAGLGSTDSLFLAMLWVTGAGLFGFFLEVDAPFFLVDFLFWPRFELGVTLVGSGNLALLDLVLAGLGGLMVLKIAYLEKITFYKNKLKVLLPGYHLSG